MSMKATESVPPATGEAGRTAAATTSPPPVSAALDSSAPLDPTLLVDTATAPTKSATAGPAVLLTPKELPQCYPCKLKQFYIRDCYPDYYDYVLESMAAGKRYIIMTGTPGIGKSVFYLYFFEKFKVNCDKKIVVASYSVAGKTKAPKLKECKIWDPKSRKFEDSDDLPKFKGAIYLIDGIPDVEPHESNTTIIFASPDVNYFITMNKYGELYREIYMPNWTLKEIMESVDALGLTQKNIKERWKFFGGAPRYLFESDLEAVERAKLNVRTAISSLHSVHDVFTCFDGTADPDKVLHGLMHYDVEEMRGVFDRRLKMASKDIAYAVQERLNKKLKVGQQSLMGWLSGTSKSAAFLGWLFEGFAHEKLLEGCDLPLKGLNSNATEKSIKIGKTIGTYTKFRMATLEEIFEEAYQQLLSDTLRSVDSYYMTKAGVLWLFQMTRNIDHEINVEGLLELLEKLKKLEDTQNVNLVFVVPKDVGEKFPVQTYKLLEVFGSDLSDGAVRQLDVDKIPSIAGHKKRKLNQDGIFTIDHLLKAKEEDPSRVSSVRCVLATFEINRLRHRHQQAIINLKQYCMELDYELPDVNEMGHF